MRCIASWTTDPPCGDEAGDHQCWKQEGHPGAHECSCQMFDRKIHGK